MIAAIFLPPAEDEMIAAAQYYEQQSVGLGSEFLNEVERTVAAILVHPEAAPRVKKKLRRRLLKRFPFGILYSVAADEVVIVALMHLQRRPGYWEGRLHS
ncbi:MAG: type II toxin-antitoxin system RelE/ParE family toxin [Nitrospira sp. LK70]|nr:type II toxin-antitoxin system RelE/ParE family toxin [Nitrospira sp. LK70]